jgi:hypothetical protein
MKKFLRFSFVAPVMALLLAACGAGPAPAPTSTPLPTSTPTPVPPTVTPIPTATTAPAAAPAAGAGGSVSLLTALTNAQAAKTYKVAIDLTGKGAALSSLTGMTDTEKEVALLNMTGEFSGLDGHYVLKGMLSAFIGADPNVGLEGIQVGGKSYLKGPVAMLGAKEAKWYVVEGDAAQAVKPPLEASDMFRGLSESDIDLSAIQKTGSETFDGKTCDIFTADKDTTMKVFSGMNASGALGAGSLTSVQAADATFAVCDDGFLHRIQLSVTSGDPSKPEQKMVTNMLVHMYDYDVPLTITAPEGAEPLKVGVPGMETATPQP